MTSSEITKYACILYFREIVSNGWLHKVKIVNLVHDEILVECPIELEEVAMKKLIDSMELAGKPFCPIVELKAEAISGKYWVH